MVASLIEGRARIRDERFREPSTADAARERLLVLRGIASVTVNRRVGSVLVLYDELLTGIEEIIEALAPFMEQKRSCRRRTEDGRKAAAKKRAGRRYSRKAVAAGMLVSLLATVTAAAGSTGVHVAAGVLFLGLAAMHVAHHRQALGLQRLPAA